MKKGVSIVICCYNSANRIIPTLQHIKKQIISKEIACELIIVDNNSNDQTQLIAQEEWHRNPHPSIDFKIVEQPLQGLSYARDKGINEARYDYVLFCDDDNWLKENYITVAFEIMKNQKNVGAVGGEGFVVSDSSIPKWFNEYSMGYAIGKQAKQSGILHNRNYLYGAGIVIRKHLLLQIKSIGFKWQLTGRNGQQLLAGDDSEMCRWILLMGYHLWFDERLQFKHYIPHERLSVQYRDKMWEGFNQSLYWLNKYDDLIKVTRQKRNKLQNFVVGFKHLIFNTAGASSSYIQFLIGPYIRISNRDNYNFIKQYYHILYQKNN